MLWIISLVLGSYRKHIFLFLSNYLFFLKNGKRFKNHCLKAGVTDSFWKGPDRKYLWLWGSYTTCCESHWTRPLQCVQWVGVGVFEHNFIDGHQILNVIPFSQVMKNHFKNSSQPLPVEKYSKLADHTQKGSRPELPTELVCWSMNFNRVGSTTTCKCPWGARGLRLGLWLFLKWRLGMACATQCGSHLTLVATEMQM